MFGLLDWLKIGAGAIAGALLAAGPLYLIGKHDGRAVEQAAIVKRIEKENADAGTAAENWRAEYRRCADAGRLFDFETGACEP